MKSIFGRKKAEKMEITAERDRQARLAGLERMRINLLVYRDHEAQHRLTCFVTIVLAIVVGFVALRYVRVVAPRAIIMVAVAAAAIASSTGFTSAHMQCRAAKRHILDVDERIHQLRVQLGMEEEEEPQGRIDASELPSSGKRNLVERADEVLAATADATVAADEVKEQALLDQGADNDEDNEEGRR